MLILIRIQTAVTQRCNKESWRKAKRGEVRSSEPVREHVIYNAREAPRRRRPNKATIESQQVCRLQNAVELGNLQDQNSNDMYKYDVTAHFTKGGGNISSWTNVGKVQGKLQEQGNTRETSVMYESAACMNIYSECIMNTRKRAGIFLTQKAETEAIMGGIRPMRLIVSNPGKWSPALDGFFDEEWNAVAKSSTYRYQ